MELDATDLRNGLEFICGKWQAEYVVNAFSNDLARIPASEWKSDDGSDFSAVTFDFDEEHNVIMRDGNSGKEENGTWEDVEVIVKEGYGFDEKDQRKGFDLWCFCYCYYREYG